MYQIENCSWREAGYAVGFELTWYLLTHSLSTYPEKVVIKENVSALFDEFINKIKNSRTFQETINTFLCKKNNSFSQDTVGVVSFPLLPSLDLYLSLHDCTVWVEGEKNDDGTWNLQVLMVDIYNFDYKDLEKLKSLGEKLSWAINNIAYSSQEVGAITPFDVEIRFTMENYKIKRE